MIELKAGVMRTPHNEGMTFDNGSSHIAVTEDETEFYLKSEADEKIAELNVEIKRLMDWNKKETKCHLDIERHSKYKRCLAKAEMCGVAFDKWMMKKAKAIGLGKDGVEYFLEARRKVFHYGKWNKRWLKIAEQFNPNKLTA